jgi:hypothetical protein
MKEIDPIIIAVAKQYGFITRPCDDGEGFHQVIEDNDPKQTIAGFYWCTKDGTIESFFDEVATYFKDVGEGSVRHY